MTDLLTITTGMKTALATISGLHAFATEPSNPPLPAAWPALEGVDYDATFGGGDTFRFRVWVVVPLGTDINRAQTFLLPFLQSSGSKSIKAALEADPTLGGVVDDLRVVSAGPIGPTVPDESGNRQLAAPLTVEVFA